MGLFITPTKPKIFGVNIQKIGIKSHDGDRCAQPRREEIGLYQSETHEIINE